MINILKIETNFCDCLIRIFIFLGYIMNFIKILVPIIIILMGSIDLIKAVIAQKDDEMKKAQSIFIKRLIYGVVLFFVIAGVQFLIGLVGGDTNNRCFKCVANVNSEECDKENIPVCSEKQQNVDVPDSTPESTPETPTSESPVTPESPVEGCRITFYGLELFTVNNDYVDVFNPQDPAIIWGGEILGKGDYKNCQDYIPKSYGHSLESILIDKNTKLTIYENENFGGNILFEGEGPLAIFSNTVGSFYTENRMGYTAINDELFAGYNEIFKDNIKVLTWDTATTAFSFKIRCSE